MSDGDITTGTLVHGRYRLLERVGGGGMGHVFRADDTKTGRTVAIKLLHRELWSSPDVTARLFQEAKVLSSIRHPNIVEILDADTSEHGPFIAMEHLDGSSAGVLLAIMGRFDETTTIAIAIPVLAALEAAHRSGVVHRDLKPENVFVCRERKGRGERGSVHLLDFGIAKIDETNAKEGPRTRTGVVFGTPDYLSPEQATGEGPLDGRSDLFSLGIVMFELLTGRRPFTASTAVATAFRIVHASPPSFESLGVAVSAEVSAVIRNLLAKSPQDRPSSATEVLRVLTSLEPDDDVLEERLLNLLSEAETRRRKTTRPPPPSSRGATPPAIGLDLGAVSTRAAQLPPRALGRCARGIVLRSVDGMIESVYGDNERERVVALLSDTHAEELRRGRPSALDAHDVEVVRRYVDLASRVLGVDAAGFFDLGRKSVDKELGAFVGTLVRPAEFSDVIRRSVAILRCFFDFGSWTIVAEGPRRATLRIEEFELVAPLLRSWLLGVIQRIFERAVCDESRVMDATPAMSPVSLFVVEVLAPASVSGRARDSST
ncbi:MAG: serine/threonine protein kinase [Polyangiaceae bacterium]|nr:serine/threonine protein kinase [Polyangiaceae bacterium]